MANAPSTEITAIVDVLGLGGPDGTVMGQAATDKIAFYGKVPYAQKASAIQASALVSTTGTASSWGAQAYSTSGTATTWSRYAATTANLTATSISGPVLGEVCEILAGLGLMKGAA